MLEIKSITKRYGKKLALDQVSISFGEGVYGLLGPNGAGKSTLMNLLTLNLRAEQGEILWEGRNVLEMGREYRRLLGYAPQQQGFYDSFSGRRFLGYMACLKGIRKAEAVQEISRVLDYVNMNEAADRAIGGYSGGMKQRILIAQAMLGNPRIIVLDEPTAGLDPKERIRIREKIAEIAKERTVLLSTHVVSDVAPIAKEIILLKEGQIVACDTVENLCRKFEVSALEEVYMHIFGGVEDDEISVF